MNETTNHGFESTVLQEFGKVGTAIRKSSEATNKRIDDLGADLSQRITGLELRLERNDGLTRDSLKRLKNLEESFENHKQENADEISQLFETASPEEEDVPEKKTPFSISVTDLLGFLKILPLFVAVGVGIGGAVFNSCSSNPGDVPAPSQIERGRHSDQVSKRGGERRSDRESPRGDTVPTE